MSELSSVLYLGFVAPVLSPVRRGLRRLACRTAPVVGSLERALREQAVPHSWGDSRRS